MGEEGRIAGTGVPTMNANHGYFLRSERLGFRIWVEDDLDLGIGLWGAPAAT